MKTIELVCEHTIKKVYVRPKKRIRTTALEYSQHASWEINAGEFRDYILGSIFSKNLSGKMKLFANGILKQDKIKFREINPKVANSKEWTC